MCRRDRGVAIAAAMKFGLRAEEYAPRKIKQSITGRGNASKEQLWEMLQHTLGFQEDVKFMDATDAVGVALCHHYQTRMPVPKTPVKTKTAKAKKSSWAAFLSENPDRIVKKK